MPPPAPTAHTSVLRIYNTLTRRVEPLIARDPAHVTFYTCGPTVYDDAHIGNFRSFLAADVLRRWIESPLCALATRAGGTHGGPRRVTHVMNITDVGHMTDDAEGGEHGEDRMVVAGRRIAEAKKSGKLPAGTEIDPSNPWQIARFYEGRFKDDARRLGLRVALEAQQDPTLMPRATESIEGMKALIARLIARGHAYVVGQPGGRVVYFDVRSYAPYGRLSGNTLDALKEGEGGRISAENQAGKRHPADFLLWKEDAGHIMKWDSPWGAGYPGWHIECSVMSASRLRAEKGKPLGADALAAMTLDNGDAVIDVHSGGEDNIFPHHECEIAQSCCAFNAAPEQGSFSATWFHPRFLMVEGDKMSKSKGNFFTARDLFGPPHNIEPGALRLELIKTHYRTNANFTMQGLKDSQRTVERWRRFLETAGAPAPAGGAATGVERAFAAAMNEDLNIAGAIGEVNKWIGETPAPTAADARALLNIDAVLGVLSLEKPQAAQTNIGVFIGCEADPAVLAKLEARLAARQAKDFASSDRIRDELAAMGYAIKDVAGGKVEVRKG
ncbi:MAG: cysteine--tRNA ligase [Phycisphaeraceae bacterium]|nr:cysteine--tRNA ligase [Phycisphaeraceae bacterium]